MLSFRKLPIWTYLDGGHLEWPQFGITVGNENHVLMQSYQMDDAQRREAAILISAAPDMFAALEACLQGPLKLSSDSSVKIAMDALAKARGEL